MRRFPRKWDQALAALLASPTIATAATAAGIGERTLRQWCKCPAFSNEYKRRSRAVLDGATSALAAATQEAVETLIDSLKAARPSDKIRAALGILTQAIKTSELLDLEQRLQELEERFAQREQVGVNGRMHR
jgi:hypothetical protein